MSDATVLAYLRAFVASATHCFSPVIVLNVAAQSPAAYTLLTDVCPWQSVISAPLACV